MSSSAPLRDSSVGAEHLRPHLRRRLRGRSLASYTATYVGTGTLPDNTLWEYTSAGGTVSNVVRNDWGRTALTIATAVTARADVTATAPWTFTAIADTLCAVIAGCTVAGDASSWLVMTIDGVDVASSQPAYDGDLTVCESLSLLSGQTLQIELRTADWDADEAFSRDSAYTDVFVIGLHI